MREGSPASGLGWFDSTPRGYGNHADDKENDMYQEMIRMIAKEMGRDDVDPRHILAYMYEGHSTLDGLARWQFREEVEICIGCVDLDGVKAAERCALSHGLKPLGTEKGSRKRARTRQAEARRAV